MFRLAFKIVGDVYGSPYHHLELRAVKNVGRGFNFPVEARGGFPQFLGTLNILKFIVGNGIILENLEILICVRVEVESDD